MLHSKRQSTQFESIQTQQLKPTGTITAKSVMKRQRKTHHTIMNNDKGCAAMEQQEVDVQSPSPVTKLRKLSIYIDEETAKAALLLADNDLAMAMKLVDPCGGSKQVVDALNSSKSLLLDEQKESNQNAEDDAANNNGQHPNNNETAATADEVMLICLGRLDLKVVGMQYYTGKARVGEHVNLIREPSNPYDRSAIRMDNIRGAKIGHLKGTQAALLAPVMDQLKFDEMNIQMDAIVENSADHNMSVRVDLYCKSCDRVLVYQWMNEVNQYFRQLFVRDISLSLASSKAASAKADRDEKDAKPSLPPQDVVMIDWQAELEALDEMYDKHAEEQLCNLPLWSKPTQFNDSVKFYNHQELGVRWMLKRETTDILAPFFKEGKEFGRTKWVSEITGCPVWAKPLSVKGGILADDMGLGKTLQTLGLILSNPPEGYVYAPGKSGDQEVNSQTLPSKDELWGLKVSQLKHILVDSGVRPAGNKHEMVEACDECLKGELLTIVQYNAAIAKRGSPSVANLSDNSAAAPTCTLIVCPLSVMANWVEQVDEHVKLGALRIRYYHGSKRGSLLSLVKSRRIDILCVSYETLVAEFSEDPEQLGVYKPDKKRRAPGAQTNECIFDLQFHRIILDEAHNIRNGRTGKFKACNNIQAKYRLCLTGTPIFNKPDDVSSLFDFLGVDPLGIRDVFRRAITQPIKRGEEIGMNRIRAMMSHITLRRTKASIPDINIPEKTVELRKIPWRDDAHKAIHDALYNTAREAFLGMMSRNETDVLKQYMHILERILRIRQACDSGALVPKHRREVAEKLWKELKERNGKPLTVAEGLRLLNRLRGNFAENDGDREGDAAEQPPPECAICLEVFTPEDASILRSCEHIFCEACISKVQNEPTTSKACPLCRKEFEQADVVPMRKVCNIANRQGDGNAKQDDDENVDEDFMDSPKIEALMTALSKIPLDEKGVIFSQWVTFIDIILHALTKAGYSYTCIVGSMSAQERTAAIRSFNSVKENSPRFIICSLGAAGVGINLTRANHIFLCDPWWNKAVEDQAMDRVHRIGQTRNVKVTKFVMANSLECRLVNIQYTKALLGKGTLEKLTPDEARRLRVGMLKGLFDIEDAEELANDIVHNVDYLNGS